MAKKDRLRPAKGNKFETMLDSFIYAVAREGKPLDEFVMEFGGGIWAALIPNPKCEVQDEIEGLFEKEGKKPGFTLTELSILDVTEAFILVENEDGTVSVDSYDDEIEAWEAWAELCDEFGVVSFVGEYLEEKEELDAQWELLS